MTRDWKYNHSIKGKRRNRRYEGTPERLMYRKMWMRRHRRNGRKKKESLSA
jgi:hypothetical protein